MMQLRTEEFIILVLQGRLHCLLVEMVRTRVIAEQEVIALEAAAMMGSSEVSEDQLVLIVTLHEQGLDWFLSRIQVIVHVVT